MTEFAPQLKLLHHREALAAFIAEDWQHAPVQVEISPTNACPARCPWCFYVSSEYKQKHSQEELDAQTMIGCLVSIKKIGVLAVTWTGGGDPCVYSHIDDAIFAAHGLGLRQGMFTNAYRKIAQPELLDWIRITVTEKFMITKHVQEYAAKTKVGVNFNLCEENRDKLIDMVKAAKDAGVAYFQVRPALADRHELQKPIDKPEYLMNFDEPSFRVILTDYKWDTYLKPHGYPTCHGHRMVPFVWHNGDVGVCAYHFGNPEYTFGNLRDGGFRAVWLSERRKQMVQQGIGVIPKCQHNCKNHEINMSLATIAGDWDNEVQDKEFL